MRTAITAGCAFITRHVDHITCLITTLATAIYVGFYFYLRSFSQGDFLSTTITFVLTTGALTSSSLLLVVVLSQPAAWFGNVAPYRFHLVVGCAVAVLATISEFYQSVHRLLG